jgi:hypothetical protein
VVQDMIQVINHPELQIKPLNEKANAVMNDFARHFTPNTYWLGAGTVLGLYRDNEFIEGDTDIDFSFFGYKTMSKTFAESLCINLPEYKLVREVYDNDLVQQLCFMKDGVLVDCYYHYDDGNRYMNHSESGWTFTPKNLFDDRKELETKYGWWSFPFPIEDYLVLTYGEDWKVPQNKKPIYRES